MAITNAAVYFGHLLDMGEINKESDQFKMALMKPAFVFDSYRHRAWDAAAWVANTSYVLDTIVKPTTANGYLYRCVTAGTTSSTEPTWPTTFGETVSDGGATWECWSYNTSEDEITHEGGYTGPELLENQALALVNSTDNMSELTFDNKTFQASAGGSFGPTDCCVAFNDTHHQLPLVHHTDFEQEFTPSDEGLVEIRTIRVQTTAKQGVTE